VLAAQAWRQIFNFVISTVEGRDQALERLRLTPGDSRVLMSLDGRKGRAMRSLADEWGCDAATATWMVARLADRGLAARRTAPNDGRVRLIVLTPRGARSKRDLLATLYAPPPPMLGLRRRELLALRDATARLPTGSAPPSPVSAPQSARGSPVRSSNGGGPSRF
jgi:DNA-binding MarR family transcriptional regulator